MRTATPSQSIEMLLRALYEGTASDGPWIAHNGAAWEMQELAYDEERDAWTPYRVLLRTGASDHIRALTREAAQAVRQAAERVLAALDERPPAAGGSKP